MVVSALGLRRAAGRLQPGPPDPGDPGRRAADDGAEPDRAVEAGSAQSRPRRRADAARAAAFGRAWRAFTQRWAAPAACWSPSASAPRPSACRTSCSSPMAGRSCSMTVGATTTLTALLAGGALAAFALGVALAVPRRRRRTGWPPSALLIGIVAFVCGDLRRPAASRRCCSASAPR